MSNKILTVFINNHIISIMGVIDLDHLYICNTYSDYISKVNLDIFKEEDKIILGSKNITRTGPHGICGYNNQLLVANNFSDSISIIDLITDKEAENYFIGAHCNDVIVYEDNAFVICGELNSVIVFNLIKRKVIEEIPCGNSPHSISISPNNKIIAVSNMESDNITLIDADKRDVINTISVGAYPVDAVFNFDGSQILVCESNMGGDAAGAVSIIPIDTGNIASRISVGICPVEICTDTKYCFISNFGDGSISFVNYVSKKEIKKIKIGGMPRGIVKKGKYLYIGDNYNNLLLQVDILNESKKVISIGREPTGMTLA